MIVGFIGYTVIVLDLLSLIIKEPSIGMPLLRAEIGEMRDKALTTSIAAHTQ